MCLWFIYIWYGLLIAHTVALPLSKSNSEKKEKQNVISFHSKLHTYSWNMIMACSEQRSHLHRSNGGVGSLYSTIWQRQPRWVWRRRRQPQSIGIHSAWAFVKKNILPQWTTVHVIRCVLLDVRGTDMDGAGERARKRAHATNEANNTVYLYRTQKCPLYASNFQQYYRVDLSSGLPFFVSTFVRLFSTDFFSRQNFFVSFSLSDWLCIGLGSTHTTHTHTCSLLCRLWFEMTMMLLTLGHSAFYCFFSAVSLLLKQLKNERSHLWAKRRESNIKKIKPKKKNWEIEKWGRNWNKIHTLKHFTANFQL